MSAPRRRIELTEREVDAFRSAFALYSAEHEGDENPPEGWNQDLRALDRINSKLADAKRKNL